MKKNKNEVDYGLNMVRTVGSPYYKNLFAQDNEEPPKYSQKSFPIGHDVQTGEEIWMRLNPEDIMLIAGRRGSGKSFLERAIASRAFLGGNLVLQATDVKNEFRTNNFKGGVQKKFKKLLRGEKAQPIPTESYMPYFMNSTYVDYKKNNKRPKDLVPFTFSLDDMSKGDIIHILGADTSTKADTVSIGHSRVKNKHSPTLKDLKEAIDNSDASHQTKKSVKMSISNLVEDDVFGVEKEKDIIGTLQNKVVAIALENWEHFDKYRKYLHAYIAILLRRLKHAYVTGRLEKPIVVFIEEAHVFCPRDQGEHTSREAIKNLVDIGRQYGIRVIFVTQRSSQLPQEEILEQINKFFIPKTISNKERKFILQESNIYNFGDMQRNKWNRVFRNMEKYQWMYINQEKNDWRILDILSPLSHHKVPKS